MTTDISPELAEVCGVHAGDGYLRGEGQRWELDISGNVEEKDYYDHHLKLLFENLFGIEVNCRFFPHRSTYGFVIRNREVIKTMHELGFPYGNKSTIIKVPKKVMKSNNNEVLSRFLRGLFDTDGCVHFRTSSKKQKYTEFKKTHHHYPIIQFSTVSKELYHNVKEILGMLGFGKVGVYTYVPKKPNENVRYVLTLYGSEKTKKFFNAACPKNPVKLSRYLLWKKNGHCPSNLTYDQRMQMLKNTENL